MTTSPGDSDTTPSPDRTTSWPPAQPAILRVPTGALGELLADILRTGGTVRFSVRGGSMYPALRDGDIVEAAPATGDEVCTGDVLVAWLAGGDLAVHRLAAKGKRGDDWWVVLWPDAASQLNAPIPEANILGKITAVERGGQQVSFSCDVPPAMLRRARASLLRATIPSPIRRALSALMAPLRRR